MIFLENKRKSSERIGEFWGIVGGIVGGYGLGLYYGKETRSLRMNSNLLYI
jgi:hypothetical protein